MLDAVRAPLAFCDLPKDGGALTQQFADDTILFGKAVKEEAIKLNAVLTAYSNASGQKINLRKSGIFYSSYTPHHLRNEIANVFQVKELDALSRYLGVPADWGRSKCEMCNVLIERITQKIQSWKAKYLSHAGCDILVKAVLQAVPTYISF